MSLHNMQCPRCGYITTNYDGKSTWKCLQCGNELVIQNDNHYHTTNFNVNGSSLYNLDANHSIPFKHTSESIYKTGVEITKHPLFSRLYKFCWVLFIFSLIVISQSLVLKAVYKEEAVSKISSLSKEDQLSYDKQLLNIRKELYTHNKSENKTIILYSIVLLLSLGGLITSRIQPNYFIEKPYKNWMGAMNKCYSYCPYCNNVYQEYTSNNERNNDWDKGLTHCLHCGKQFAIHKGMSYRIT